MAVTLTATGITYSDGTSQTAAYGAAQDQGILISTTTFTGNGTWTKPSGCTKVQVIVIGGGGGGSGHCESGGAGGYAEKIIDVSAITDVAVTVGGGGVAVTYYASAGDGGTSSFGTYCSATGGYGANRNSSHTGGHGGVGSSGDINLLGGTGTGHSDNGSQQVLGTGTGSFFGSGRRSAHNNSNPSNIGYQGTGTGGPGANRGYNYSNGAVGMVIVYAYS